MNAEDPAPARVLLCRCEHAATIPPEALEAARAELHRAGVDFEEVADLCALAARRDPLLAEVASAGRVRILGCQPRALRWLFHLGGAPLPAAGVTLENLRSGEDAPQPGAPQPPADGWVPWFPVIDYERCTHCRQCLSFCLFDVFGLDAEGNLEVQRPASCKTSCPACARVCPEEAIIFPKYTRAPVDGGALSPEERERGAPKADLSALLGGELYHALRTRARGGRVRFDLERDEERARAERCRCLREAQEQPPDAEEWGI